MRGRWLSEGDVDLPAFPALGNRGQVNYSAVKEGRQSLTRTLAIDLLRRYRQRHCPGFIETETTGQTAERVGVPFEQFKQAGQADPRRPRRSARGHRAPRVDSLQRGAGFTSGQVI